MDFSRIVAQASSHLKLMDSNLLVRSLNPETDIPGLVQLRAEIEAVDKLGTDTSEAALRVQFDWPGHDPRQDRWVIEVSGDSGSLIAHGWTFAQSPQRVILEVAVHPSWRRRGLGSQLLISAIAHANHLGAQQIVSGARAPNKIGQAFLQACHFIPVGHNRFMKASATTALNTPRWPNGFVLRPYAEIGDVSVLVDGSNGCYADMWGHRENTEPANVARFQQVIAKSPNDYPPNGILLVFAPNDQLAGLCFNRIEEGNKKIIDSPGVIPAYRHLGLQRPLVQASMLWLNSQAEGIYHLDTWGDFNASVEIYRELGFTLSDSDHLIEYLLQMP